MFTNANFQVEMVRIRIVDNHAGLRIQLSEKDGIYLQLRRRYMGRDLSPSTALDSVIPRIIIRFDARIPWIHYQPILPYTTSNYFLSKSSQTRKRRGLNPELRIDVPSPHTTSSTPLNSFIGNNEPVT